MVEPYYQDQWCTLYHADCRDVLPTLERGSADAVIADPPYGIGFSEYKSHKDHTKGYIEWLWPVLESSEKLVENGWMVVFQSAKNCRNWSEWYPRPWRLLALPKTFIQIFRVVGPQWGVDYALLWTVGKPAHDGRGRDWFVSKNGDTKYNIKTHPCPRPYSSICYLIETLTKPGQTILDPFAGSGTTLRAAKDLGRRSIGIEIEERYCEIAARRLEQDVLPFHEPLPRHEPAALYDEQTTGD